jgi:putative ABC transport system permease protein
VRYALRSLWLSRGFSIVAFLCLGFGIGLNTTIFSIVDGVLLKPLPYEDPDRLRIVNFQNPQLDAYTDGLSFLDIRDLREAGRTLTTVAATQTRSLTISDGGEPERYVGAAVSWDMFPMLGIAPVHGRLFREDEDRVGAESVVLLSHGVWASRYQTDPAVLGRRILINGLPSTIIGVMPPDFEFPENQKLWIPLAPIAAATPRTERNLFVFARLAPGVSEESADAELTAISQRFAEQYPESHRGWRIYLRTLGEEFIPNDVSTIIWLMMAAVTLVLFIACSNVANLQLARATSRQREIALRTALGAGRGRIVRQLLTENVLLALLTAPFGLLLAVFGTRAIASAMPPDQVPYYIRWAVDWRTAAYAVAIAAGTAIIFGLLPALQASRSNLVETLKEGTRGNSVRRSWLRSSLVVIQVSLALVSLVSALLFVRTFVNLESFEVGYDTSRLMTMRFYLSGQQYEAAGAKARRVQDIVERIERLPGVEAAFSSNMVPLGGGGGGARVVVDGYPVEAGQEPGIGFTGVTPRFMETLGLPVRGRTFTSTEGWSASPVALVNETMSRQLWPGKDALGGRFRRAGGSTWFEVVGVVPDFETGGVDPDNEISPEAFVSYPHQETLNTGLTIRVAGTPTAIAAAAREEIRAADSNMPVFSVRSADDLRRLSFWEFQLFGWIFGTIGVVGLLLAAVGVYGVLSYAVSQRTAEIGVRVALGAGRRQVLQLVIGHGMLLAGIGIALGLVLAAASMPLAQQFFYNVSPFDPLTFASVAVFLALVSAIASYVPARRATRVDPIIALRGE